jgi:hypothetical protein
VAFAAGCAGLAAFGHVVGGGYADGASFGLGFLVVLLPALVLAGRERTLATILPTVAASQVILHVMLCRAAPMPSPSAGMAGMPDMADMHGMATGMSGAGHCDSLMPSLDMVLMHLVAVPVTAWWLRRGEAWLWTALRYIAAWLVRPLRVTRSTGPRPCRATWKATRRRRVRQSAHLRHTVVLRGPPALG